LARIFLYNMTGKNILLLSCAVSIIFLGGCAASNNSGTADADNTAYRQAMQAHDEKLCATISNAVTKQKCLTNVADFQILIEAQQKGDASICDKLTDPNKKQVCHLQFTAPE